MSYAEWIAAYHKRLGGPEWTYGRCREAAEEMKAAFPELEVKWGHVYCPPPWGTRGHWWLVDPKGTIVDPTAAQFSDGIHAYEEWVEGDDVRLGSCYNCGAEIWGPPDNGHPIACSPECHDSYVAYLNEE